jgi:hypothetical protein
VRTEVLALIERGAFGDLPSGLYGRHAIRAYARAVGLDAENVLEEVGPALPEPEDPLDGLARVRGLARRVKSRAADDPAPSARASRAPAPVEHFNESAADWRTMAASAIDGALLVSVVVAMAQLTALAAGAPLPDVIAVAAPAWALMAAVVMALYFVLLGGVRNATLGAWLLEAPVDGGAAHPIDAGGALRRGLRCALRESSILVDWLLTSAVRGEWLRVLGQRS